MTAGLCAVDGLKPQQQSNPVMTDEGISLLARLVVFFSNCAMAVNCVQFVIEFAFRQSAVCSWRKLMLQVQISLNVEVPPCVWDLVEAA